MLELLKERNTVLLEQEEDSNSRSVNFFLTKIYSIKSPPFQGGFFLCQDASVEYIEIKCARTNNLQSVNTRIPLNSITTICGLQDLVKVHWHFHTLLAESTGRFVNSFPAKMRLFFDIPTRVDVDSISPVLPAFGLPQNNPIINSRYNVLEHIDALNSILKVFLLRVRTIVGNMIRIMLLRISEMLLRHL